MLAKPRTCPGLQPTWVNLKMLSTNSSTSCPSTSRKYSATVRPAGSKGSRTSSSKVQTAANKVQAKVSVQSHVVFQASHHVALRTKCLQPPHALICMQGGEPSPMLLLQNQSQVAHITTARVVTPAHAQPGRACCSYNHNCYAPAMPPRLAYSCNVKYARQQCW